MPMSTSDELELNQLLADKDRRVRETQKRFQRAVEDEKNFDKDEEIKTSFKAYESDPWPEDKKRIRDSAGKPTNDIARYPNIVDVLSGNQRQTRSEPRAFAFESDDFQTAEFSNLYLKYRIQKQRINHENSLLFVNGVICGRAHREYSLENNPIDGSLETRIRERPADECFFERPFREIDNRDGPGFHHAQWMAVEKVKELFGGPGIDLTRLEFKAKNDVAMKQESTHVMDEYSFPSDKDQRLFFKNDGRQVRLIRYWRKRWRRIYLVQNIFDPKILKDVLIATFDTQEKAVEAALEYLIARPEISKGIEDMEAAAKAMVKRSEEVYYNYHVISGTEELVWKEDAGPFIPFMHFFAYFANGRWHGTWSRLKDEVKTLNFLFNKLIERLGKIGWQPAIMEEDALPKGMTQETFLKNWRDGMLAFLRSGAIGRNKFRIEQDHSLQSIGPYVNLVQFLFQNMQEKIGANDPFRGVSPGANTAGVAIEKLQTKAAAVVEPVFDNFRRFRKEDALMEIKMLMRAYDQEPLPTVLKMERIIGGMIFRDKFSTGAQGLSELLKVGEVAILNEIGDVEMKPFDIKTILEEMKFIEYDINIDEAAAAQTLGLTVLQTVAQLSGATGLPVAPDILVDLFGFAGIPDSIRNRWLTFLQQQGNQPNAPTGTPAAASTPVGQGNNGISVLS